MDPCNNVKKPKYMHLQWDLDLNIYIYIYIYISYMWDLEKRYKWIYLQTEVDPKV